MLEKNSFDFYNLWEELHNDNFNSVESHRIKIDEVGYNRFTMTPNRWKKDFNAISKKCEKNIKTSPENVKKAKKHLQKM